MNSKSLDRFEINDRAERARLLARIITLTHSDEERIASAESLKRLADELWDLTHPR